MAAKVANDLKMFSGYSFCKAHSTSYTYIAIITLYLSYYFRANFYAALVANDSKEDLSEKLVKIKAQGFSILQPDVNKSDANFSAVGLDSILFGLSSIKNVSAKASVSIIENRPFTSLFDFIIKTRSRTVTSAVMKALISIGAFDCFDEERKKLLFIFNKFWENKKTNKVEEKLLAIYHKAEEEAERIPGLETTVDTLIEYEKEYYGFNFFTTPFSETRTKAFVEMSKRYLIKISFDALGNNSAKVPVYVESIRKFQDKNGNDMCFIRASDIYGQKESFPLFHSYYQFIGDQITAGSLYLFNLYKDDDDKIMFGERGWVTQPFKIRRMVKEISGA